MSLTIGGRDSIDLSLEAVFALLSDQRRRYTLACLADTSRPIAVADLAEDVAAREHDVPVEEVSKEDVQTVYITLYHVHLPKLSNAGAIEYDGDRKVVRPSETTDQFDHLRSLLVDGREARQNLAP